MDYNPIYKWVVSPVNSLYPKVLSSYDHFHGHANSGIISSAIIRIKDPIMNQSVFHGMPYQGWIWGQGE